MRRRRAWRRKATRTPIAWLPRDARYVEKLATPDVTIADMIGDIDPIKAARGGLQLADELTMHYGLLPRANRGIFAINELPDLAGKIQVGLFNILQEGDVQIKGYPGAPAARRDAGLHRQPRGLHGARQDHHAAQGPHRLRDPHALPDQPRRRHGDHRAGGLDRSRRRPSRCRRFVREVVEEIAFQARSERRIDKRSGVSQRLPITVLENVVSNAERRALAAGESPVVPRITDVYAALPSITGKFELEYEGELKGADNVAREIIRAAVGQRLRRLLPERRSQGGRRAGSTRAARSACPTRRRADVLVEQAAAGAGPARRRSTAPASPPGAPAPLVASAIDFVLEGLYAQKQISRTDERGYHGAEPAAPAAAGAGPRARLTSRAGRGRRGTASAAAQRKKRKQYN